MSELKENLGLKEFLVKIFNMKWVDVYGNYLNIDEYKFYDVLQNDEFDLDYLIDICDYNNFISLDLMIEELEINQLDLFETINKMINDYYFTTSTNSNVSLVGFEFKLYSYQIN